MECAPLIALIYRLISQYSKKRIVLVRFFILFLSQVSKAVLLFFSLVFAYLNTEAQTDYRSDSLTLKLQTDSMRIYRTTIARLFLKLENRHSPLASERVSMIGLMGGITLKDYHSFFIGYFFMLPQQVAPFVFKLPGLNANQQEFLNMNYGLIGYQYVLHKSRYFQANLPVTVGLGHYDVNLRDENTLQTQSYGGRIVPFSAGVQLIGKPVSWLGLSVSGGYRYMAQQQNASLSLHGAYYSFGLWMDGRFVSRHLRYKNRLRLHNKAIQTKAE
jgi:hypothetical protein